MPFFFFFYTIDNTIIHIKKLYKNKIKFNTNLNQNQDTQSSNVSKHKITLALPFPEKTDHKTRAIFHFTPPILKI